MDKFEIIYSFFKETLRSLSLEVYVTKNSVFIKSLNSLENIDLEDLIEAYEDIFFDDSDEFDKVLDINSFQGRCELLMEEIQMKCFEEKVNAEKFWDYLYTVC